MADSNVYLKGSLKRSPLFFMDGVKLPTPFCSETRDSLSYNVYSLPALSISSGGISLYSYRLNKRRRISDDVDMSFLSDDNGPNSTTSKKFNFDDYKKQEGSNKLSSFSIRKIAKSIKWLEYVSKPKRVYNNKYRSYFNFKLAFVTLTLPSLQQHDDKEIKSKCFDYFLNSLRKRFDKIEYIWRAERQKNGNIHFHIVIDSYIDYNKINYYWNTALERLGYISSYQKRCLSLYKNFDAYCFHNKQCTDKSILLKRYKKGVKTNWSSPNTSDVHSLRKIKNVISYVTKYLTKDTHADSLKDLEYNTDNFIKGRIWGQSYNLSRCTSCTIFVTHDVAREFETCCNSFQSYTFQDDYIFYKSFSLHDLDKLDVPLMKKFLKVYIDSIFK